MYRLATSGDSSGRHRRSSTRANEEVSEVVQLFAGEWVTAGWSVRPGYWEKIC